jgi:hypothetical protein
MAPNLFPAIENVIATRREIPPSRAVVVAISGIDASGKGYVTGLLAEAVQAARLSRREYQYRRLAEFAARWLR